MTKFDTLLVEQANGGRPLKRERGCISNDSSRRAFNALELAVPPADECANRKQDLLKRT
jgi:hypothetical protein